MTSSYDDLHVKYSRGDSMPDEELATLHGYVSRMHREARTAPNLIGHATVAYLALLSSTLRQLCEARRKLKEANR